MEKQINLFIFIENAYLPKVINWLMFSEVVSNDL